MVALKGSWRGGPWRVAPAIEQLWREANAIAPNRDRSSDGTIGDPDHAARKSNHNPQESGATDWVDAIDIDHDPANGMDIHARVRQWVAALDERLDEVISNDEIWTWERRREGWRPYKGSNRHRAHAHITVRDSQRHSTRPWFVGVPAFATPGPPPYRPKPTTIRPTTRRKPMWLVRVPGRAEIYATDGVTRSHVTTGEAVAAHQHLLRSAGMPDQVFDVLPQYLDPIPDVSNFGVIGLSVMYVRAIVDKIAKALKVPTS